MLLSYRYEPVEIILARYLDDLGLPYVFDVKGLGQPAVATMLTAVIFD